MFGPLHFYFRFLFLGLIDLDVDLTLGSLVDIGKVDGDVVPSTEIPLCKFFRHAVALHCLMVLESSRDLS